jgi:hypothetical protein
MLIPVYTMTRAERNRVILGVCTAAHVVTISIQIEIQLFSGTLAE